MKNILITLLIIFVTSVLVSCSNFNFSNRNLSDLIYLVKANKDNIYLSFFDNKGNELKSIKFSSNKEGLLPEGVTEGPPAVIVQDGESSLKIFLSVFNEERYETYNYDHSKQKIEKINNLTASNWNLYFGEKYIYNTISKGKSVFLQKTNISNQQVNEIKLPYSNPEKIITSDKQDTQYILFNEEDQSILVKFKNGKKVKEIDFKKTYIGDIEIFNDNIYVAKMKERLGREELKSLREIEIFNSDLSRINTIKTKGSPNLLKINKEKIYVVSDGDQTFLEEYDTNSLSSMNLIKLGAGSSSIWDMLIQEENKVLIVNSNSLLYVDRESKNTINIDGDTKSVILSMPNVYRE